VTLDPFPHYETLRALGPVHFLPRHGFWLVVGYEEVQAALTQPQLFSNRVEEWQTVDRVLLGADPPAHTTARRAVVPHFNAQAVQSLAAFAEQTAERLLRPLVEGERCDVLRDFSAPLAEEVAAHLIGFNAEALAEIRDLQSRVRDLNHWLASLDSIIEAQAARLPLYEQLLQGGDGAFDAAGCRSLIRMLWVAGTTTTRRAVASSVLMLLRNPSVREKVTAEPALFGAFFEESIRLHPPEHTLARATTAEAELGAVQIPSGAAVRLCVAAANRDPARFEDPATFILERANVRQHLSFGGGVHRCLGAGLAHAEAKAALRTLLRLAPRFRSVVPVDSIPFAGFTDDTEQLLIER
ncbi:MAG TPA: cytochrome P450, partial [Pyrinomonadaceae bacterium]